MMFTRYPWRFVKNHQSASNSEFVIVAGSKEKPRHIANLVDSNPTNAALIAAAPNLYRRLDFALRLLEQYYPLHRSCEFVAATRTLLESIVESPADHESDDPLLFLDREQRIVLVEIAKENGWHSQSNLFEEWALSSLAWLQSDEPAFDRSSLSHDEASEIGRALRYAGDSASESANVVFSASQLYNIADFVDPDGGLWTSLEW